MPQRFTLLITCMLALLSVTITANADDPEVIVETDREAIFLGESFIYQVTLNHFENPSEPDLSSIKDVTIEKLGEQALNSTSITIINGVRKTQVRFGRVYQYRLTPNSAGNQTIPAPTAEIDGKILKGRTVTLQVVPPLEQDWVVLETTVDKQSVYPMQPFTVTLTIKVISLPEPREKQDPLSILSEPPKLDIPWFNDDDLKGLAAKASWRKSLEPILTRNGGFAINNIGDDSITSMFRRQSVGFRPEPERITETNDEGDELNYWVYEFSRTFIPKTIGQLAFGPVTAKGSYVTGIRGQRFKVENIFAAAKPVTVTVKDVPLDDRPDNWSGIIGQFDLSASLTPSTASVGDPLTLRLALKGNGTFENMSPPDLASISEIADNFKIYEATQDTKPDGSGRTFTYSLRPTTPGLTSFPSIEVPCFDVEQEQYTSLKTEPINVEIRAAEKMSASDIVAGQRSQSSDPRLPVASADGIFGNNSNVVTLTNDIVHPGRWVMAWAGMLGFGIVGSFATSWLRNRNTDTQAVRKRTAFSRATSSISSAESSTDALQAAIVGLIADVTGAQEAGIAARDAQEKLRSINVDSDTVEKVGTFLDRCDAARYGSDSSSQSGLKTDAESLVQALKSAIKQAG